MIATSLAHETARTINRPHWLLALAELPRSALEISTLPFAAPFLAKAPQGDGHRVMVLPGFISGDGSTAILRRYLTFLGYDVHAWGLGRNMGWDVIGDNAERLVEKLDQLGAGDDKVSLVGWSLGGVMARQVAHLVPEKVRQVVTLGSPFTGNPKATSVAGLYEIVTGRETDGPHMQQILNLTSGTPPVPSTAIFSKSDGIVAWQNCTESDNAETESIETRGSHCGLTMNSAVLYALADRLALPEGAWEPFDRHGWRSLFYPESRLPS